MISIARKVIMKVASTYVYIRVYKGVFLLERKIYRGRGVGCAREREEMKRMKMNGVVEKKG